MSEHYIATEFAMSAGVGVSEKRLPSFDKALIAAKVGNYNLVRLSSILPAHCKEVPIDEIGQHIKEGSLLPTAYATISATGKGTKLASAIGIGFPEDPEKVGVIMEYSALDCTALEAKRIVEAMVEEGFKERGWGLRAIKTIASEAEVEKDNTTVSTFACVAEW